MSHNTSKDELNKLVGAYFQGRMTRRQFICHATRLGLSAALVSRLASVSRAASANLIQSSPVAANESPITAEHVEYLKSKPYKDITLNIKVIRSAVGDCVEYHPPRWEEETAAHVNITKVPIDTIHDDIFGDLSGPGRYDAYQTAA